MSNTSPLPNIVVSSPGTYTARIPGTTDLRTASEVVASEAPAIEAKPAPESSFTALLFRLSDIRGLTQHLTGRLKTLIDGAVADPVQRKALKDLIHTMTWEEHYGAMSMWATMAAERNQAGMIYNSPPFSSTSFLPPEERF